MDGDSLDLIIIPIVVMISLAAWLIAVAYAATHPQWKNDAPAGASSAELARTATGGPILDFGPARGRQLCPGRARRAGRGVSRIRPGATIKPLTARGGRLPRRRHAPGHLAHPTPGPAPRLCTAGVHTRSKASCPSKLFCDVESDDAGTARSRPGC